MSKAESKTVIITRDQNLEEAAKAVIDGFNNVMNDEDELTTTNQSNNQSKEDNNMDNATPTYSVRLLVNTVPFDIKSTSPNLKFKTDIKFVKNNDGKVLELENVKSQLTKGIKAQLISRANEVLERQQQERATRASKKTESKEEEAPKAPTTNLGRFRALVEALQRNHSVPRFFISTNQGWVQGMFSKSMYAMHTEQCDKFLGRLQQIINKASVHCEKMSNGRGIQLPK